MAFVLSAVMLLDHVQAAERTRQEEALESIRAGNPAAAIEIYKRELATTPTNTSLRRDLMWLLWEQKAYEPCALQAEQIIAADPKDLEALELAARCRHRLGDYEAALGHYHQLLADRPGHKGTQLEVVRILEARKDYNGAMEALNEILRQNPDFSEAMPIQGRLHEAAKDYAKAVESWAAAVAAFPENQDYLFRHARSLYFSGETSRGLDAMRALLASNPGYGPAREFMVSVALVKGDLEQATILLNQRPWESETRDVPYLLRLAGLHAKVGNLVKAGEVLDRALILTPENTEALGMKGENQASLENWRESVDTFQRALSLNPAFQRAWLGLANSYEALEDYNRAFEAIQSLRQLDPTSPSLLLREAQLLYRAGRKEQSRESLEEWLAGNVAKGEVPILLYHGLATSKNDPMLASAIHLETGVFAEQLRELRRAGYETISLQQLQDWLRHREPLPPKPVIIAFDDGRIDSFEQADPVLQETGFRATMFVAGINSDRNLPGYANWEELRKFQQTGRWNLESHGDRASINVPVDAEGLEAKFLANQVWLPDEGRLETEAEWEKRVRADYASIAEKLERHTGRAPIGNAWPEGTYGQQAYVNIPRAAERNLDFTREKFELAFHQNGSGVNPHSRDPILLERFEPRPEWNGQQLVKYLEENSPALKFMTELLQQALWDGEPEAAKKWVSAIQERGVSSEDLLWASARIAFVEKDYASAAAKARQFLADNNHNPGLQADVWNFIGQAHWALGEPKNAIQAYDSSLAIDPDQPQVMLDKAIAFERLREYRLGLEICKHIQTQFPCFNRVLPALAKLHDLSGNFSEACRYWQLAAAAFPGNAEYQFRAAKSQYTSGESPEALAAMFDLLERYPEHLETRRFLIQAALLLGEIQVAVQLLEEQKKITDSVHPNLSLQIAGLHIRQKNYGAAEAELREALRVSPSDGELRLLLAETLRLDGRSSEALPLFASIAAENPWSMRASLGLADAQRAAGLNREALETIRELRKLYPQNPELLLREADFTYGAGERQASAEILNRWLMANRGGVLPVLCYHGLTENPADPILAQRIHHSTGVFDQHLAHLRAAGYQTVSAEQAVRWMHGQEDLPERAVMITFDDGRLDSLRLADPILAKHGFTAVMFVDGQNASRNLPNYATWAELRDFRDTGRWDLQSHGNYSSSRVPVGLGDHEGRFLTSRRWLFDEKRLETAGDWRDRVKEEHRTTIDQMVQQLGKTPVAFAWPEGDFGQQGIPNIPDAVPANISTLEPYYALAFHQNAHGFNLQSSNPLLMTRLEPPNDWTGAELVQHLQDDNPQVRAAYQLLRQAAWNGRIHEGYRWLDDLKQLGASESRVSAGEAILLTMAGNPGRALTLLDQGGQSRHLREHNSLRTNINQRLRPSARFTFDGWLDDEDRQTLALRAGGGWQIQNSTRLNIETSFSEYHEEKVETSLETAAGLYLEHRLNAFHLLGAGVGGHLFSGPGKDMLSYEARWDASWTDQFRTGLGGEYQPGYTVKALMQNIRYHQAQADASWTPWPDLRLNFAGHYWSYSDENERLDATLQAGYTLPFATGLQALYRFSFADTKFDAPAYYTPQQLIQNQVGLEYLWNPSKAVSWRFRYLPGYGREEGRDGRIVHAAHTDILFRDFLTVDIRSSLDYQQTPTYQMLRFLLTVEKSF